MITSTIPVLQGSVTVPSDFCGNHFNNVSPVENQYRSCVLHDAAGCDWGEIHTAPGVFNWSALDARVASIGSKSWTYVVSRTPTWASARPNEPHPYGAGAAAEPADMSNLYNFIVALCNRYPTLSKIEVWNEPDIAAPFAPIWYTGTVATFVTLTQSIYNAAKSVRPQIKILGPSCTNYLTTWFKQFLQAGGGSYIDAWAIHGYFLQWSSPNNSMLGLLRTINCLYVSCSDTGITKSEIYLTEFGQFGARAESSDSEYIRQFKQGMILAAALKIKQASWYAYDDAVMGYSGRPVVENAIADFINSFCGSTLSNVTINMPECSITCSINGVVQTI